MDIYSTAEDAGTAIRERFVDEDIKKAVAESLVDGVPHALIEGPSGFLWRHIGTPDGEFARFLALNEQAGTKPVCFEYVEDKFAARNFTKYALANLAFSQGVDKSGKTIVKKRQIIDFKESERKRMIDLQTTWDESLVDFHHYFLTSIFPVMKGNVEDISVWVRKQGETPKEYYPAIISLAVAHGVFFDDLDLLDTEAPFVREVVLPAIEVVHKRFGLAPLVVKISKPGEHEQDPYWWSYSKEAEQVLDAHIANTQHHAH